jgi:GT2 family glycosyltransferase
LHFAFFILPFSLLIATRDRPAELNRCLAGIACQRGVEAEVVVLDDASSRPTDGETLQAGPFPVRLLRSETRVGVGAGRNWLMREARGDAFVVLDDDAFFVDDDALLRLEAALARYPEAGILALKIRDFRGDGERWLTPHPRGAGTEERLATPHRVAYFLGGAHVIRRAVIEMCGEYPESYAYGNEELDLAYRAIDRGFAIQFVPDVVVHHKPPAAATTGIEEGRHRLYHHTRSRLLLAHTHLPAAPALVYSLCWASIYGCRALRQHAAGAFLRGVCDAWREAKSTPRTPIGPAAIAYLRDHFGRLWI